MIARAETHEAGFCHNMRLRESYLACIESMRRNDHERGVLNPRYSRESTDATDVVDYLREDDNSMPEGYGGEAELLSAEKRESLFEAVQL